MVWLIIAGLSLVTLKTILALLGRVTAWGGDRPGGHEVARQVMAEADVFRGAREDPDLDWDGRSRIGPVGLLP